MYLRVGASLYVSLAIERQSKTKNGAREGWRDADRRRELQRLRIEGYIGG